MATEAREAADTEPELAPPRQPPELPAYLIDHIARLEIQSAQMQSLVCEAVDLLLDRWLD